MSYLQLFLISHQGSPTSPLILGVWRMWFCIPGLCGREAVFQKDGLGSGAVWEGDGRKLYGPVSRKEPRGRQQNQAPGTQHKTKGASHPPACLHPIKEGPSPRKSENITQVVLVSDYFLSPWLSKKGPGWLSISVVPGD